MQSGFIEDPIIFENPFREVEEGDLIDRPIAVRPTPGNPQQVNLVDVPIEFPNVPNPEFPDFRRPDDHLGFIRGRGSEGSGINKRRRMGQHNQSSFVPIVNSRSVPQEVRNQQNFRDPNTPVQEMTPVAREIMNNISAREQVIQQQRSNVNDLRARLPQTLLGVHPGAKERHLYEEISKEKEEMMNKILGYNSKKLEDLFKLTIEKKELEERHKTLIKTFANSKEIMSKFKNEKDKRKFMDKLLERTTFVADTYAEFKKQQELEQALETYKNQNAELLGQKNALLQNVKELKKTNKKNKEKAIDAEERRKALEDFNKRLNQGLSTPENIKYIINMAKGFFDQKFENKRVEDLAGNVQMDLYKKSEHSVSLDTVEKMFNAAVEKVREKGNKDVEEYLNNFKELESILTSSDGGASKLISLERAYTKLDAENAFLKKLMQRPSKELSQDLKQEAAKLGIEDASVDTVIKRVNDLHDQIAKLTMDNSTLRAITNDAEFKRTREHVEKLNENLKKAMVEFDRIEIPNHPNATPYEKISFMNNLVGAKNATIDQLKGEIEVLKKNISPKTIETWKAQLEEANNLKQQLNSETSRMALYLSQVRKLTPQFEVNDVDYQNFRRYQNDLELVTKERDQLKEQLQKSHLDLGIAKNSMNYQMLEMKDRQIKELEQKLSDATTRLNTATIHPSYQSALDQIRTLNEQLLAVDIHKKFMENPSSQYDKVNDLIQKVSKATMDATEAKIALANLQQLIQSEFTIALHSNPNLKPVISQVKIEELLKNAALYKSAADSVKNGSWFNTLDVSKHPTYDALRRHYMEVEKAKFEVEGKLRLLQQMLENIGGDPALYAANLNNIKAQLNNAQLKNATLEQEKQALELELKPFRSGDSELQRANATLKQKISEMTKQLEAEQQKAINADTQADLAKVESDKWQKKYDSIKNAASQVEKLKADYETTVAENEKKRVALEENKVQLEAAKKTINDKENELIELRKKPDQAAVKKLYEEIAKLKDKLKQDQADHDVEIAKLKANVKDTIEYKELEKSYLDQLDKLRKKHQEDLSKEKLDKEIAQKEFANLREAFRNAYGEEASSASKKMAANEYINFVNESTKKLYSELNELRTTKQTLQMQLDAALAREKGAVSKQTLAALEESMRQSNAMINEKIAEISRLQTDLKQKDAKIAKLNSDLLYKARNKQDFELEIQKFKDLEEEIAKLRAQNIAKEHELKGFQTLLKDIQSLEPAANLGNENLGSPEFLKSILNVKNNTIKKLEQSLQEAIDKFEAADNEAKRQKDMNTGQRDLPNLQTELDLIAARDAAEALRKELANLKIEKEKAVYMGKVELEQFTKELKEIIAQPETLEIKKVDEVFEKFFPKETKSPMADTAKAIYQITKTAITSSKFDNLGGPPQNTTWRTLLLLGIPALFAAGATIPLIISVIIALKNLRREDANATGQEAELKAKELSNQLALEKVKEDKIQREATNKLNEIKLQNELLKTQIAQEAQKSADTINKLRAEQELLKTQQQINVINRPTVRRFY